MADDLDLALSRFRAAVARRLDAKEGISNISHKQNKVTPMSAPDEGLLVTGLPIGTTKPPLTTADSPTSNPEPDAERITPKRSSLGGLLARVFYRVTQLWAHSG
jgi:hypothetical protein